MSELDAGLLFPPEPNYCVEYTVHWYQHDCPWWTKYCDEEHRRTAVVPLEVLVQYETPRVQP